MYSKISKRFLVSSGVGNLTIFFVKLFVFLCRWWAAYKDAQAFRFGHYYVGYFSEVCCLAMGVAILENVKNESSKNKSDVIKGTFTSTPNEASSEINGVVTPEETVDLKMVLRW